MKDLDILKWTYREVPIRIFQDGEYFEFLIINAGGRDNISVDNRSGIDPTVLTFRFSYQHAHFENDRLVLIAYINASLSDSTGALEFFREGKPAFGGSISLLQQDAMSPGVLAAMFGYRPEYLVGKSYKIRSWSGRKDLDAEVVMENDQVTCRRIK